MPERIDPLRREDGVRTVPEVQRQRLLSPTEREDARRRREEARRRLEKRPARTPPSQGRPGGADYLA